MLYAFLNRWAHRSGCAAGYGLVEVVPCPAYLVDRYALAYFPPLRQAVRGLLNVHEQAHLIVSENRSTCRYGDVAFIVVGVNCGGCRCVGSLERAVNIGKG